MNARFWKQFYTLALAGVLCLSLGKSAAAQRVDSARGHRLTGTWTVQVQQRDCETGAALGNPFPSLLTFARGGTMTEATANPMFYPDERGPGHGVWNYTGGNSYRASSIAFITASGALAMTQVITQTIEMGDNPDEFQAVKASVQFFDPSGNLLRSGCATAIGNRFK